MGQWVPTARNSSRLEETHSPLPSSVGEGFEDHPERNKTLDSCTSSEGKGETKNGASKT